MGKMTRTRRTLIAADMARILRELQQVSAKPPVSKRSSPAPQPSGSSLLQRGK